MNLIWNEYVKLDETCQDTQGRFKANLLNVMNVLGRLTYKLPETWNITCIHYKKLYKDLIKSWNKHIGT